jgi:(1->4)-alpha-D-glucan 1-alpha-D-glucosylmutase
VPDLYQGCEFWDFSLVDPDNRRPVDFRERARSLEQEFPLADYVADWRKGSVKQRLIAIVLNHRAQWPQLYSAGDYIPLAVAGARAAHAIAFERRFEGLRLVCVASRWAQSMAGESTSPLIARHRWEDTSLSIEPGRFVDVLHGGAPMTFGDSVAISEVLSRFPVALLARTESG